MLIPKNEYILVEEIRDGGSGIMLPDETKDIGAKKGRVFQSGAPGIKGYLPNGSVVYFDGSKAFRIVTADAEYIAVKQCDLICVEQE